MKEDIRETRFDNRLVVLTDRMSSVRSATLGFFYRTGARHEPEHLHGITHFIEHSVFKGTSRRTARDIAIEQDRLGGTLDAFTTHEETGFVIKVIDDQIEAAFDLISDMLTEPRFDETNLVHEQHVIIEEMKMIDDDPDELLGEIFQREFFAGTSLGPSIPGTPETVRSFDHDRTRAYHGENFTPSNLVIAAAGNIEHEEILQLAHTLAENHPAPIKNIGTPLLRKERNFRPETNSAFVIKQRSDLEQAHLIIATPFVSAPSERRYAADLLEAIFGGGTSSRLWQKIREERGLAYNVGASAVMYQDVGFFSVFAATSPEQIREVVELSIAELRDIAEQGVTEAELDLAKAQSRAAVLLGLEDSASRVSSLAHCEMVHGRQIPVEETLSRIDAVTPGECHELAAEFFRTESLAFAAIGDLGPDAVTRSDLVL